MSDTRTARPGASTAAPAAQEMWTQPETTGWVGWNVFAATMMMIGGVLQAIYGFIALVNDEWVVWGNRADLYVDLTTWGWVHLGIGVVVFLAGIGILSGNVLARTIGVVLASVSLIANFLFLPAYPFWALTVMVIDGLVIWALTAHGHEMRKLDRARREIDLR